MVTAKSMPLDAPLYQIDPERGVEYWNCRLVAAAFVVDGDVADLVPQGLHLASASPLGLVMVADYGMSTLGPYREFVSFLQVVDDGSGELGMYIPSIYVTNDAALAAGREVLGAPKKLAEISLVADQEVVTATLARPAGTTLARLSVSPAERLQPEVLDALLPSGTPFFSLRHLPAPPGGTTVTELVRWTTATAVHTDAFGDALQFTGPASLTFPAASAADPVHRLGVGTLLGAIYLELDLRITAGRVVRSETRTEPAAEAFAGPTHP